MENKKYELLKEDIKEVTFTRRNENGEYGPSEICVLYRIKALRSFGNIKEGDLGGYIESEDNLSHDGTCWIYDDATVLHGGKVYENAQIHDKSSITGNSEIFGDAILYNARIELKTKICGNVKIANGYANIHNSTISGNVTFYGDRNLIAFCNINGDIRIESSTILGIDNENRAEIHCDIYDMTIKGNAKIDSVCDYGKICGCGLDFGCTFFKTTDNEIKFNLDGLRPYTMKEFEQITSVSKYNSKLLIEFIKNTILGEQVIIDLPKSMMNSPW